MSYQSAGSRWSIHVFTTLFQSAGSRPSPRLISPRRRTSPLAVDPLLASYLLDVVPVRWQSVALISPPRCSSPLAAGRARLDIICIDIVPVCWQFEKTKSSAALRRFAPENKRSETASARVKCKLLSPIRESFCITFADRHRYWVHASYLIEDRAFTTFTPSGAFIHSSLAAQLRDLQDRDLKCGQSLTPA